MHADVLDVVEFGEDAQLGELRDAGEEYETEIGCRVFQGTAEIAHDLTELREDGLFMHDIEQRGVIFVDEYDDLTSGLFIGGADETGKAVVRADCGMGDAIGAFVLLEQFVKIMLEAFFVHVFATAHAEMEYGMGSPVFFQSFDGESFEKLAASFKIAFEGGHEQRFAETAGTTEKDVLAVIVGQAEHESSLVDIDAAPLA